MAKSDNIFLIGPMGVGKTTIGRKLARRLDKKFLDSDKEIEKKTGATINLIFDVEGESGFRERESRTIDDLSGMNGIVLATGGGAVLSKANREMLCSRGIVVYLEGSAGLLLKRTAYDNTRPLLDTDDREGRIRSLLQERGPIYAEVADTVINVDDMKAADIVSRICDYLDQK